MWANVLGFGITVVWILFNAAEKNNQLLVTLLSKIHARLPILIFYSESFLLQVSSKFASLDKDGVFQE